ncbi:MAG: hypothetical protein IJX99_06745 [Clostridia bacterium]|nr:hypothetical protein [Clostridia bacterium]
MPLEKDLLKSILEKDFTRKKIGKRFEAEKDLRVYEGISRYTWGVLKVCLRGDVLANMLFSNVYEIMTTREVA